GGGLRGAGSPGGLPKRAADADDREVPHRGQARDPAAVPRGSLTIPVQGPSTTPVVPGGSPIAMILCTCMMPAFAYRNTQFSVLGVVTANRSYTGDGITSASDAFDGFLSAIAAWDYLKWGFQQANTVRMSSPAQLLGVQRAEDEKNTNQEGRLVPGKAADGLFA